MARMTREEIKDWVAMFDHSRMVNIDAIKSVADVKEAKRFCSCMRNGIFWRVTDAQWFEAIQERVASRLPVAASGLNVGARDVTVGETTLAGAA
jgi:hypothetical protein